MFAAFQPRSALYLDNSLARATGSPIDQVILVGARNALNGTILESVGAGYFSRSLYSS